MPAKKSEFGKISGVDLLNALYHAVAAVCVPFLGFLAAGRMPDSSEGYMLLSVFLGAIVADLFKRANTNSSGESWKKE